MLSRETIADLLSASSPRDIEALRKQAYDIMVQHVGETVYYRGIIEISNVCGQDCLYCGIRKSNKKVNRYTLNTDDTLEAAKWCADEGYGSVVIQSGEQTSDRFVNTIADLVEKIKIQTTSKRLPNGLGITLSLGELPLTAYKKLRAAGAHRYLLRIETSSRALFQKIHPKKQSFENRIRALEHLRHAGFQVGTGVMIGIPEQTNHMLADDILFFKRMDVDMVGMGPFIPHNETPFAESCTQEKLLPDEKRLQLALNMIAATRIVCPNINIASTTALQALTPNGRERGLTFGANVTMPNLTPKRVRKDYTLYDGKPCLEESKTECRTCLLARVESTGRNVGFDVWGDSPHAKLRKKGQ